MSNPAGKKFDQGKPDLSLLSSKALLEIAKVMDEGAKKYGAQNWRNGIKWSRVYAAIQRHLLAWLDGETYDKETGINHLAHAGCGIMFLLEYAQTHGDLDDRYNIEHSKAKVGTIASAVQPVPRVKLASSKLG